MYRIRDFLIDLVIVGAVVVATGSLVSIAWSLAIIASPMP